MIHKEGRAIVIYAIAFCFIVSGFVYRYYPSISLYVVLILLVLLGFVIYFFRKPDRDIHKAEKEEVIAPADGKIVSIEEVQEDEYLGERCRLISIFMSPLNVHINWNPVSGTVVYHKYHPGKYLVAWHPKSSLDNERTTSVIDTGEEKILIRQIAGAVARRIINYHTIGQEVKQGSEMGFIRFGSRVDIYIPLDYQIVCEIDQKVKGLQTVLARKEK